MDRGAELDACCHNTLSSLDGGRASDRSRVGQGACALDTTCRPTRYRSGRE